MLKSREFVKLGKLGNSKDIPINVNPISVKNSAHLDTDDNLLRLDVVVRESKITLIRERSNLRYFANVFSFSTNGSIHNDHTYNVISFRTIFYGNII